jgi:hypothetical protein
MEPVGELYVSTVLGQGAFAITTGDEPVPILALDPETVATLARLAQVSWTVLVETPTADLDAALGLVHAAERQAGVEHDPPGTVAALMARFVRLDPRTPEA